MVIAGTPSAIGTFESVLPAVVTGEKPSALAVTSATWTMRALSLCAPVGRMPMVSMVMVSFARDARSPVQRAFSASRAS